MKSVKDNTYNDSFGRTICEVHREIYDELSKNEKSNEIIIEKLEEAYQMAKKMDAKLRQYKNNYDDGWWQKERSEIVKEKLKNRNARTDNLHI
jgi:hypothetical protein